VAWAFWVVAALVALGRLLNGHARESLELGSLRGLINRLSGGRALVEIERPGTCPINAPTKEWMNEAGRVVIDLGTLAESKGQLRNESSDGDEKSPGIVAEVSPNPTTTC
jgi:hypothetical protein